MGSRNRCCCGCPCVCVNCQNGEAPCCWQVTISGVVDDTYGNCEDCADLDDTYTLAQDPDNSCRWYRSMCPGPCDEHMIELEVLQEYGDYFIRVTIGDYVWEKNYGADPPPCCGMKNESLPHVTSSTTCDSSSSTCVITEVRSGCRLWCEDYCQDGLMAPCLKMTFSGLSVGDGYEGYDVNCFNGVDFYLPCTGCAQWQTTWSGGLQAGVICGTYGSCDQGELTARIQYDDGEYNPDDEGYWLTIQPWVNYHLGGTTWKCFLGTDVPDCRSLSGTAALTDTCSVGYPHYPRIQGGTIAFESHSGDCEEWEPTDPYLTDKFCSGCESNEFPEQINLQVKTTSGVITHECTLTRVSGFCNVHEYQYWLDPAVYGAWGYGGCNSWVGTWRITSSVGGDVLLEVAPTGCGDYCYPSAYGDFNLGSAPVDCSSYDHTELVHGYWPPYGFSDNRYMRVFW